MARLLQLMFGEIFYDTGSVFSEIDNLCPNIAECYWLCVSVHFSCTNRVWHRHMVVPFTATNSDMHKVIFARSYIAKGDNGISVLSPTQIVMSDAHKCCYNMQLPR